MGLLEVACEPNGGIGTKSKFVDHPVPLVIDVAKMYWVISSRPISVRVLQTWASEVKVTRREGLH